MSFNPERRIRILCSILLTLSTAICGFAGVSRTIQEQYRQQYENKVMFLKTPIYSEQQQIYISGERFIVERETAAPPIYNVGDQLRVYRIDFGGDEIKFRMGPVAGSSTLEILFRFDGDLQEEFPKRASFDRALQSTLTEGLKYTEIEEAKKHFIDEQFDRSVSEIAGAASSNRAAVLERIASQVPAYQEAQRQVETLESRVQDISSQLSASQEENRKLQSEMKTQEAEVAGLKRENAALQKKMDEFSSQLSRLGEENRNIRGNEQGYQKELESIQRSLNLNMDPGRDLSAQIADLGQAMVKLQRESQIQEERIASLQNSLDAEKAVNANLSEDNEELKDKNQKMQSTLRSLTSKEDSLAKQFLDLKNDKEKLDDFVLSVKALRSSLVEEKTENGTYYGKANIYLNSVLLGSLDWKIPVHVNHGQNKNVEASFSAESVDTVQMTPEERHILRSFGEKLKIGLDLSSSSAAMEVTPAEGETAHEIDERAQSTWQWVIANQGAQESRIRLSARLINGDSSEIPLLQQERPVIASNAVRQIRDYLRPIPLAVGAILGFLLFGIVGIFRRPKARKTPAPKAPPDTSDLPPHNGTKQL
jgi:peptidoglycan hydrolase CwlO-like protein